MVNRKIALAGNPNSGKTTIFNRLCGARERIGNWSGTTVERKEGKLSYEGAEINVVDLPGTYSLSAYSIDERIARDFLLKEKPDLVVAIIDATNLERNLYLVSQLMELGQNVLLALNMMDVVESRKMKIDTEKLSRILKTEIVETVASKGRGIDELRKGILENLSNEPYPLKIEYGNDIENSIREIEEALDRNCVEIDLPLRALALKYLEGDQEITEKIRNSTSFDELEGIRNDLTNIIERKYRDDLETFIIEKRYAYLKGLVMECVQVEETLEDRLSTSDMIDKVLTNRVLGIPIFIFLMFLLFKFVFALGNPMVDFVDSLFGSFGKWVSDIFGDGSVIGSLLADGVIAGVGGVLVFLPLILLLYLGISLLEGSGYMARAAFVMDRFMHALGLHGKSFIPMLIGFGCNIPGIMATRTLESRKDRIITILILPLMSCAARLPVYTLFARAFFPSHQDFVVFSLYLIGIIVAIIVSKIFKGIFFREESAPLIMELPPYRMPTTRNILLQMWMRAWLFVRKAGTIILAASILIWVLANIQVGGEGPESNISDAAEKRSTNEQAGTETGSAVSAVSIAENDGVPGKSDLAKKELSEDVRNEKSKYEHSLIGVIGKKMAPVFRPAGFDSWEISVALVFGAVAKEIVVGTMGVLIGTGEEDEETLQKALPDYFENGLAAYSFLLFVLLYFPCFAAIAAIKRETNWKWTSLAVAYTTGLAWIVSVAVYQIGSLFI